MPSYKEYSIGNVADILDVPVHTVRFWTDQFRHIECVRRNNRRYYDDRAIDELKKIKELSHQKGIKIKGIQQMLKYKKINMDRLNVLSKANFQNKLDILIKKIDKIIFTLS